MAEARDRAAWNRTLAILAHITNFAVGTDDEPVDPMQFYPWPLPQKEPAPPPTPEEETLLTQMFSPKPS